jgi:hypothetical protein
MSTTIKEKLPQTVTLQLEVKFELGDKVSIVDAMSAAESLIDAASERPDGGVARTVTGTVVIGRQKFAL